MDKIAPENQSALPNNCKLRQDSNLDRYIRISFGGNNEKTDAN
jgi:hypothetical protein